MKLSYKPYLLKLLAFSAGLLGLALQTVLFATGVDEKGLLINGHWSYVFLWVLTLTYAAGLAVLVFSIKGSSRYQDAYPVSVFGGIGAVLAAVGLIITSVQDLRSGETMILKLTALLGVAAALGLSFVGYCRITRKKPLFVFHALVSLYFALRLVGEYRLWSSDPQIQDYCFYLGAYIGLMITAYQHAAFDAGMGSHRALWFVSLLTVYLCIMSLLSSRNALLLLLCGVWVVTNMTDLTIRRRQEHPTEQENPPAPEET